MAQRRDGGEDRVEDSYLGGLDVKLWLASTGNVSKSTWRSIGDPNEPSMIGLPLRFACVAV